MYLAKGYLIKLSEDPNENIIQNPETGEYYEVTWLTKPNKIVKGGNGIVYKAIESENRIEYAIKICKYSYEEGNEDWFIRRRILRFEREIEALNIASQNGVGNVVKIIFDGEIDMAGETVRYYVMEKCDGTLVDYLNPFNKISISQKVYLFYKILQGIQGLHAADLYHRDIKRENILFLGDEPLIADLGLVENRKSEFFIDEFGELIGPLGWFTPEAISKFYADKLGNPNELDCVIEDKSDLFQLGKLFWYIFQGNLPIGQLIEKDFLLKDSDIFKIIFEMLQYSKARRPDLSDVIQNVQALFPRYNL